eukprot:gnl/MRDRNA2_/MRDRNA2_50331_c0_seq1.p1 gnl/MRDRNA2_/MRDRNA2_50331_c0~~gnl/MRDRNA2_/MRDRNA2_50331_c0_seq1.p1  ORF type:complete len:106 (+),score=11.65 gnl/MRDRNA2_/MRDRNA2_50331_c0_seq1:79-396(+)
MRVLLLIVTFLSFSHALEVRSLKNNYRASTRTIYTASDNRADTACNNCYEGQGMFPIGPCYFWECQQTNSNWCASADEMPASAPDCECVYEGACAGNQHAHDGTR